MRIKKTRLLNFKRFDDLTIELGDSPQKIIALVGPNGCGKSSVFDGFLSLLKAHQDIGSFGWKDMSFYSKEDIANFRSEIRNHIEIEFDSGNFAKIIQNKRIRESGNTIFSFRSSYRMSQNLDVREQRAMNDIKENNVGASNSTDPDDKMIENYKRLLIYFDDFRKKNDLTDKQAINRLLGDLNTIIRSCLDLEIVDLGNILAAKGKIYFLKRDTKRTFDFNILSSGEKEVVDILLDLFLRKEHYNDTIYCIEEPELHLNTAIQRKMLIEIEKIIPESCQLWISTHSVGFLRALQEELKNKCQILDFSEKNYFTGSQTIEPLVTSRSNWQRIFQTALDDLTGLLAPKTIIYCEGRPMPGPENSEQGLDAYVYNQIFSEEFSESLFISSGGGTEQVKHSALGLSVLSKAFKGVELLSLKDRDGVDDSARNEFLKTTSNRMLTRREIENYLFDDEILNLYCVAQGRVFDQSEYSKIVTSVVDQDLKPLCQTIQHIVGYSGRIENFKKELAKYITNSTKVYNELKLCIFN